MGNHQMILRKRRSVGTLVFAVNASTGLPRADRHLIQSICNLTTKKSPAFARDFSKKLI
jgi:hypothetical protein